MAHPGSVQPRLLDAFLHEQLRELYDAEHQLLRALPRLVRVAGCAALQDAFEAHLDQTESHIERLEQVLYLLGHAPEGRTSAGMAAILAGLGRDDPRGDPVLADIALIAGAQKVEHLAIATYACVCTYADLLRCDRVHRLLSQSLADAEVADEQLSQLAQWLIAPAPADDAAGSSVDLDDTLL
jgi:ferritin-like metal-binding protein YciE